MWNCVSAKCNKKADVECQAVTGSEDASVNIPLAQVWIFFMWMLPSAIKRTLRVPKCVAVYHPLLMVENLPTIYCVEYAQLGEQKQLAEAQSLFGLTLGVGVKKMPPRKGGNPLSF